MNQQDTRWIDYIVEAMKQLGGNATLSELYRKIEVVRNEPFSDTWQDTVRRTIQQHSSDTTIFNGKEDIFYSVDGLGNGRWGLRNFDTLISVSNDDQEIDNNQISRELLWKTQTILRPVRNTPRSKKVKEWYDYQCQICSFRFSLPNGNYYAEVHHLRPLGNNHKGSDDESNMVCVCANCHAMLDYGARSLNLSELKLHPEHKIDATQIEYHNTMIFKSQK